MTTMAKASYKKKFQLKLNFFSVHEPAGGNVLLELRDDPDDPVAKDPERGDGVQCVRALPQVAWRKYLH
jgi:hypothetical protein